MNERVAEFESHIWNHTDDPFQQQFDIRRSLSRAELRALRNIVNALRNRESNKQLASRILAEINKDSNFIFIILQIVGSTRNKIITDLKAATAGTDLKVPQSPSGLHSRQGIWELAGDYLARRVREVCTPLVVLKSGMPQALEAMNQATWPGWIRQERAKRQGHQAEYLLAVLYKTLAIPFEPEGKAENPLIKDAQVNGLSYDLVVPNAKNPVVCVKSTVHTSNIGQYGESKDALEVSEAADKLGGKFPSNPPTLLALIDGVGFKSNRAGLEGVLTRADEFCQFRTLWKAGVVASSRLGREITISLPEAHIASHEPFLNRWKATVTTQVLKQPPTSGWVQAGEGFIRLNN